MIKYKVTLYFLIYKLLITFLTMNMLSTYFINCTLQAVHPIQFLFGRILHVTVWGPVMSVS